MFDLFLGELLLLLLIIFCTSRIFFTKNASIDSAVFLSPIVFLLSILEIFVWGLNPLLLIVFFLSIVILITNGHALIRLSNRLFVDYYSPVFIVFTVIELLVALFLTACLIFFAPVNYSFKENGIKREKVLLSGTLANGLTESSTVSEKLNASGILYKYEPIKNSPDADKPIVLFVSSAKAPVSMYEPYLLLLAKKDYQVFACDFYSSDARIFNSFADLPYFKRFFSLLLNFLNPKEFKKIERKEKNLIPKEYSAVTKFLLEKHGKTKKVFFVTDKMNSDSILNVMDEFPENQSGFFSLSKISEYKSSGFGFVEQNDIILARYFKVQRDSSLFIPRYVAGKTASEIKAVTGL